MGLLRPGTFPMFVNSASDDGTPIAARRYSGSCCHGSREVATYVDDADLGADEGWKYATWVAVAYILSRGLAKAGTHEPYIDRD